MENPAHFCVEINSKEMGDDDIATVTRLFGGFLEAQIARVLDAEGKEIWKEVVIAGEAPPAAPEGGKVKLAPLSRIFPNEAFGFRQITVERPLRDEAGHIALGVKGKLKGKPQPDSSLRNTETVPLAEDEKTYFKQEVLPHAPDAWIDVDLSRFSAAPSARLSHLAFESDRAFPTQC